MSTRIEEWKRKWIERFGTGEVENNGTATSLRLLEELDRYDLPRLEFLREYLESRVAERLADWTGDWTMGKRKSRKAGQQYDSEIPSRAVGLTPIDNQSNGIAQSPRDIDRLISKILQLPKRDRESLEVYIDALLSRRAR